MTGRGGGPGQSPADPKCDRCGHSPRERRCIIYSRSVGRSSARHRSWQAANYAKPRLIIARRPACIVKTALFADHLIHAWDLARAIGADERLDGELVASCASWFEAVEDAYRSAGVIAARPPVAGGADAQTVLLACFGRRA
jgi:hypothetical protein